MIGKPDSPDAKLLNDAMIRVLDLMDGVPPGSEEYEKLLADLERLSKVRTVERPTKLSRDTMAIVLGNLLGILVIVAYEQGHVMNSKGLGFVMKTKLPN